MDSWSTPSTKILKIIKEDYMKMLEMEKAGELVVKTQQPTSELDNNTTTVPLKPQSNNARILAKKIRNFVHTKRNAFIQGRLQKPKSLERKSGTRLFQAKSKNKAQNNQSVTGTRINVETLKQNEECSRTTDPEKSRDPEYSSDKNAFMKDIQWWSPPEDKDNIAIDFCRDTSLHGLKYIGQQNRHISERIFWLVAFFAGLILAVILINDVWNKYNSSPIIVSFEPTQITVERVPFPAVTVCNMNKVLKSKAVEYIGRAQTENTLAAKADVFYLDHVCTATKSFSRQFNFSKSVYGQAIKDILQTIADTDEEELTKVNEFLRKASQNCSDMIPYCVWQDQEFTNCSELFRPIETEFGKCCTFNMIPQSELYKLRNDTRDDEKEIKEWMQWSSDSVSDADGVLLTGFTYQFPRRQMKAGKSYGLSFLLNPNLDEYFCTTSDSTGFRLATHWNTETPHVTDFGISVRTKAEVFVNVKPEITLVDPTVFKFDTSIRQCYKLGEFSLEYFKYYTSRNCIDECIANETFRQCKCKRYFMPRSENQTLCGGSQLSVGCAENVKLNMTKYGDKSECQQCLPSCSEIEYQSTTTATPLQTGIWTYENGEFDTNAVNGNVSIVHVFVGMDSTYAKVRKELFGSTDLFANTGGLMGLCLGFSGLSLMEVVYFLTLRAWWISKRKNEIRKTFTKKLRSAWIKVKTLRMFKNETSFLDEQANCQEENLEKVVGSPDTLRLHMSPVYENSYINNSVQVQLKNETEKVSKNPQPVQIFSRDGSCKKVLGRQNSASELKMGRTIPTPKLVVDYKNLLGNI